MQVCRALQAAPNAPHFCCAHGNSNLAPGSSMAGAWQLFQGHNQSNAVVSTLSKSSAVASCEHTGIQQHLNSKVKRRESSELVFAWLLFTFHFLKLRQLCRHVYVAALFFHRQLQVARNRRSQVRSLSLAVLLVCDVCFTPGPAPNATTTRCMAKFRFAFRCRRSSALHLRCFLILCCQSSIAKQRWSLWANFS